MRPGSSPGCGRPGCWCGCGSARSIRARSPATRSPCPARTAVTGRRVWYGGGRLAAGLTLPRLRSRLGSGRSGAADRSGAFRFTDPGAGRDLRARGPPGRRRRGAHPVFAPAVIRPGRLMRRGRRPTPCTSRRGRCATRSCAARRTAYDRAARAQYGRIPRATARGQPAARRGPADGADRPGHRRCHAGHRRAHRQPGGAGRRGRRAARGPAARGPSRSGPKGGHAAARC